MSDAEDQQATLNANAIAIIGMACRFPGASSVHQYWQNLLEGVESVQVQRDAQGRILARAEISHLEDFDYGFFGFSLKEAQLLDPQHRLLLECAWEVLEEASLHQRTVSTGVFCGSGPSSYLINNVLSKHAGESPRGLYQSSEALAQFIATDKEFLASRIAYRFNCCGPAVNIQAACATSLFGVQAAIQSLLLGECDTALAGAAAVSVPQSIPYHHVPGMPFSADGHCRPFDAGASGTVFGSGAAMIALKRLDEALADGDSIHAVIRSVATNNDGAHRAGMLAPSVAGQARVIREALDLAGIDASRVGYIEAHGTATPIGDPIEIKALARAYSGRQASDTCHVGSVKGNIGHLGWAAGMAGLIKAVLVARHRIIPPTLNFETYNPELFIEQTPFAVNRVPVTLDKSQRVVAVSSFGLGGNNAHLILEAAPDRTAIEIDPTPCKPWLIPITARDTAALQHLCDDYSQFLERLEEESFGTFVANLWLRRSVFDQRTFIIASQRQEAIRALRSLNFDDRAPGNATSPIALMFSGQGGEHRNMGRSLHEHEPRFRDELQRFDPVCVEVFGARAADLLFDPLLNPRIEQDLSLSQPMTFAVQVAMARLLLGNGIEPAALVGHSLGEYAAASMAGVFSAEQGFRMLVERGRLLESVSGGGAMLVIAGDRACALRLIEQAGGGASIAALNASNNSVISGSLEAIDRLEALASLTEVSTTRLNISCAGHSHLLDPLLDRFETYLAELELSAPTGPLISTLTGKLAGQEVATAEYWKRQLRETVNFRGAMDVALDLGCSHIVEIGPKASLSGLVIAHAPPGVAVVPIARGDDKDHWQYLKLSGSLFAAGVQIDPPSGLPSATPLEGLPTYPFQRVRCWIDPAGKSEPLTGCSYCTQWRALNLEGLDSLGDATRKVLFLAPRQTSMSSEFHVLQRVFGQLQWIELERFMDLGIAANVAMQCATQQAFAALGRDYPEGVERIYLDLRHILDDSPDTSVVVCAHVLNVLRGLSAAPWPMPHVCVLFATPAAEDAGVELSPVAASLMGMLRSVLVEEPEWKASVLHFIRPAGKDQDSEAAFIQLLPLTGECVISVNEGRPFVPRLERLDIGEGSGCDFSNDLSYLLIGGGGGIGSQLIECLCADNVRAIHVIGRSSLPGKALGKLMARHPNVRYLGLDLASAEGREQCAAWLQTATLGRVAVFNLAVDLDDKLWQNVSSADLDRAFRSKCATVLGLYQLLCDQQSAIELVFNFSSATSVLGNGGQTAYGAASAFLDAAHYRLFPRASRVITVNWGVWRDAGKLRDDAQRLQVLAANGLSGHSNEQGLCFIRQLLAGPSRQASFMNIQIEPLGRRSRACAQFLQRLTVVGNAADTCPTTAAHRLAACTEQAQRALLLEQWLVMKVDELVGLEDPVGTCQQAFKDSSLKAMGFDSLALVQLKNALSSEWGLAWDMQRLHALQSVGELQAELLSHVSSSQWRAVQSETQLSVAGPELGDTLSLQQARWLSLIGKGYGLRVIPYLIHCQFNANHCQAALAHILDECSLLRTYFPCNRACEKSTADVLESFAPLFSNLSALTESGKKHQLSMRVREIARTLPQPGKDVSWSIHFLDVGKPFFIALLGVQHLEFDGKSLTVFFDRFAQCLHRLSLEQPLTPRQVSLDYGDYVRRQRDYQHQWKTDAGFFKGLYSAFERPTALPGHRGFLSTCAAPSSRYSIEAPGINRDLDHLAERHEFSVFNAVLYVYAVTMAGVIGCGQVMISTINSGRGASEFNDVIGPFTSPLPVPITVHHDWISGIRIVARTLDAMQSYPLMHPSMLIDSVPAFSGMAQDSYFSDLGINFLNYRQPAPATDKVRVEGVEILGPGCGGLLAGANVEDMQRIPGLHLVVEINGDDLRFNLWFHNQRFELRQVRTWGQSMIRNFEQLLRGGRDADE